VQCFDTIPHPVILTCLRKRIKDERFIDLIRKMLQAGVIEAGHYERTYSGTPQGGLASPSLSNIVLQEFDCWMEQRWQANPPPLTTRQQQARPNREYRRHKNNRRRWRAQLAGRIPLGQQTPAGLRTKIKATRAAQKRVPSVVPRRLISDCRYADDYVVVLCQHSKAEAQHLKEALTQWLKEELGLTQHPTKTRITHWDERLRLLGYDLRGQRNLNSTRWLRLSIPPEKERALKGKVKRLCGYTQIPELDVVTSVNALLRGWTQYFRYANNASQRSGYLTGVVYWLGAPYLGRKHRCSIKQLMRTHYGKDPQSGKRALYITTKQGQRVFFWNKPPARAAVFSKAVRAKDTQPLPLTGWARGRSYEQRATAQDAAKARCQGCRQVSPKLSVQHPNRVGRVPKHKKGAASVIASGHEQQVKLLGPACHQQHHANEWKDKAKPRQDDTGERGAARSCPPSSEGAERKRAAARR